MRPFDFPTVWFVDATLHDPLNYGLKLMGEYKFWTVAYLPPQSIVTHLPSLTDLLDIDKMSPTNTRKAYELLYRAGSNFDDQATLMPFNKPVYNFYVESFPQEAVDKFDRLFNHGVEERRLSYRNDPIKVSKVVETSPASPVPPNLHICRFEKQAQVRRARSTPAAKRTTGYGPRDSTQERLGKIEGGSGAKRR